MREAAEKRELRARSWLASWRWKKARGEISTPWEGEERKGRGRGNGGWENVEMGRKELLRAGGSGERMDANAFIGRGCSVIAQAARGERKLAR